MNSHSRKLFDMTIRDLAKRKAEREKGVEEADKFLNQTWATRKKIRGDKRSGKA